MNLLPVLERLRDRCAASFYRIDGPSELLPMEAEGYPTLVVIPSGESVAADMTTLGAPGVLIRADFSCVISAVTDVEAVQRSRLEEAQAAVRAALMGYQASGWEAPCEWAGGQLVEVKSHLIHWRENFSFTYQLNAACGG